MSRQNATESYVNIKGKHVVIYFSVFWIWQITLFTEATHFWLILNRDQSI